MKHWFAARNFDSYMYGLLCLYALMSDISLAVANFAIDAAILLWMGHSVLVRKKILPDRKLFGLLGLLALYITALVISGLFAYDPGMSIQPVWRSFYYMFFPLLLAWRFVDTERKAYILLGLIFLSVGISSVNAILQSYQGMARGGGFIGMLETASHIVQVSSIVFALLYSYGGHGRGVYLVTISALMLLMAGLLVTSNRQSWLGQGLSLLAFGFLAKVPWKKFLTILMVAIIIVGVVMALSPQVNERMRKFADRNDQSKTDRISMWKTAIHEFVDHPVIGVGPRNSAVIDYKYIRSDRKDRRLPLAHPHNTYLQLLAETGMVGFIVYVLLYGFIILAFYKQYRRTQNPWMLGMVLSLVSIQFCGLTENFLFGLSAVKQSEWFFIGMAWRMKEANSIDL